MTFWLSSPLLSNLLARLTVGPNAVNWSLSMVNNFPINGSPMFIPYFRSIVVTLWWNCFFHISIHSDLISSKDFCNSKSEKRINTNNIYLCQPKHTNSFRTQDSIRSSYWIEPRTARSNQIVQRVLEAKTTT